MKMTHILLLLYFLLQNTITVRFLPNKGGSSIINARTRPEWLEYETMETSSRLGRGKRATEPFIRSSIHDRAVRG
jgi:hypothetical protein